MVFNFYLFTDLYALDLNLPKLLDRDNIANPNPKRMSDLNLGPICDLSINSRSSHRAKHVVFISSETEEGGSFVSGIMEAPRYIRDKNIRDGNIFLPVPADPDGLFREPTGKILIAKGRLQTRNLERTTHVKSAFFTMLASGKSRTDCPTEAILRYQIQYSPTNTDANPRNFSSEIRKLESVSARSTNTRCEYIFDIPEVNQMYLHQRQRVYNIENNGPPSSGDKFLIKGQFCVREHNPNRDWESWFEIRMESGPDPFRYSSHYINGHPDLIFWNLTYDLWDSNDMFGPPRN